MPKEKIYKCCICKKVLNTKPHRLVHQEYIIKGYGQYRHINNYDFCDECFSKIIWIKKGVINGK